MTEFDRDYVMTIGGKPAVTDDVIKVTNPATGAVFASAPDCSPALLEQAVQSSRDAYKSWSSLSFDKRATYLERAGDLIIKHSEELSRLFTKEQGRPVEGAAQEIMFSGEWLKTVAKMRPPVHVSEDSKEQYIETRYVPLGVVCAIAPWNFPINLAIWKMAPALLAGNTMVLKPSPFTPLCTLKIGELLQDVIPPGVFNVISGGDRLGPLMTSHPGFDKISFTGSTETGKKVMESAARDLKALTLELGGNDAAIVLPDVDVEAVAQSIFFGAFANTAQICVATKRLYIHESIYDKLRDQLVAIAKTTKIGDGSEQGTVLGPIQNKRQYDRVLDLIEDARENDLTLLECNDVPNSEGYYIPITIVDNPPEQSRVVQEEAFGPVLPLIKFASVEDVIQRANDSEYGLAGSVWSNDVDEAIGIARRLETGTVWINQNLNLRPDTPFAGHKQSGFGVENGMEGLLEFMVPQAIYVARQ